MTFEPKISIICPLYNKKKFVKETLDSVLHQSYKNWEFIIVDDGSTDGSYEYVSLLIGELSNVKLYKRSEFNSEKGGSVCRNIGLKRSSGDFIIFLDADDLMYPHCLEYRVSKLNNVDGESFALYVFNESYFSNNPYPISKPKNGKVGDKEFYLKCFLKYRLPWTIANVLWGKELLTELNGFEESFNRLQDPELHTRALLFGKTQLKMFKYSSAPDVCIRVDEIKSGYNNVKTHSFFYAVQHYVKFFKSYFRENRKEHYIKYLQAYYFALDARILLYRSEDKEHKVNYDKMIEDLRNTEEYKSYLDFRYRLFLFLYGCISKFDILKRLKLHSVIYRVYLLQL